MLSGPRSLAVLGLWRIPGQLWMLWCRKALVVDLWQRSKMPVCDRIFKHVVARRGGGPGPVPQRPIASKDSEQGRSRNRRVEIQPWPVTVAR